MNDSLRTLSGTSRLAGVIGWPVSHSRSPRLHGYWLNRYGIDGAYLPLAVRPQDFCHAVSALPALGFAGANVTVPHKEAALSLADRAEPFAARVGAANTLIFGSDGVIEAHNTDGYGFLENMRTGAPGWRADIGPAVVLGAGGASRAIIAALLDAGAPEVRLANRTRDRSEAVAAAIGGAITIADWAARDALLADAATLVNTTSLGMEGEGALSINLEKMPPGGTVCDIVYVPLETPLLAAAKTRNLSVVDGLGMLLHQARPGFAAWFGREPEVDQGLRDFILADLGS